MMKMTKISIDITPAVDIGLPILLYNILSPSAGILAALILLGMDARRIIDRLDAKKE